jgi:phospholipase/carboxylesterase
VREPSEKSEGSAPLLVMLHGVGSNEADLFGLAPYLDRRLLMASARAPVVLGPGSFGWFNIELTPLGMVADMEQAKRSLQLLPTFVDELIETHGADARRVYLLGFSQGAMMSLALALTEPERIAGAVIMSGRFPAQVFERELDKEAVRGKPFIVTHGLYDDVLPIANGRETKRSLEELSASVTYNEYPMGHEVSLESLRDVSAWLTAALDAED